MLAALTAETVLKSTNSSRAVARMDARACSVSSIPGSSTRMRRAPATWTTGSVTPSALTRFSMMSRAAWSCSVVMSVSAGTSASSKTRSPPCRSRPRTTPIVWSKEPMWMPGLSGQTTHRARMTRIRMMTARVLIREQLLSADDQRRIVRAGRGGDYTNNPWEGAPHSFRHCEEPRDEVPYGSRGSEGRRGNLLNGAIATAPPTLLGFGDYSAGPRNNVRERGLARGRSLRGAAWVTLREQTGPLWRSLHPASFDGACPEQWRGAQD